MKIGFALERVHKYGGTTRSTYEVAKSLSRDHEIWFLTKGSELDQSEPFKYRIFRFLTDLPYVGNILYAVQTSLAAKRMKLDVFNAVGTSALFQDVVTAQSVHKKWFKYSIANLKFTRLAYWLKLLNPVHALTIAVETIQYHHRNHREIIAISHQVKRDLMEQFGIKAERITVIHHGVNTAEFTTLKVPEIRATLRTRAAFFDRDVVVIFAAHEFRRKGLSILLQALAQVSPDYKLLVVGQDRAEPFYDEIANLQLGKRVYFAGLQKNIRDWYMAADIFAFPTSYEAFGLVITEAMASGLPVIVPRDAGAAELITHLDDGYLMSSWNAVEELVAGLRFLQDPGNREKMAFKARETTEKHTWEHVAQETLKVFERVAAQKGCK